MKDNSLKAHYRLNPFSFITETPDLFVVNATPKLQTTFSKRHRSIIDFMLGGEALCTDQLLKHISPTRIRELVSKRILLEGDAPPLVGRYSRQLGFFSLATDDFGATQQKLSDAHVLVLGAGALGSHVLWNLAAMGVGTITVVDFDLVDETNLNRQLTYTPADIGRPKVDVLCARIREFNPEIEVIPVNRKITSAEDIAALLPDKSLVIKAIDTPEESTTWLNQACVDAGIAFINGGFMDCTGVVGPTYIPGRSLCISCFAPTPKMTRLTGTGPTFGPLTTIVSSHVSMLAYKILVDDVAPILNQLYTFDTSRMSWQEAPLRSDRCCDVCHREPDVAVTEKGSGQKVRGYRLSVAAVVATAVILRVVFHQDRIGLLTLLMVLLSVPLVWILHEGNVALTRRELFVTSCIYIGISGIGLACENVMAGALAMPGSLPAIAETLQAISVAILQFSIGITALFFLLCMVLQWVKRPRLSPKRT